jgi:hypothetical protein
VSGIVPHEPPVLGDGAWRALLAILIESAGREVGPDWRERLRDGTGHQLASAEVVSIHRDTAG